MSFIPAYILILFLTIIIDYVAGIIIEKSLGRRRKLFLIISIVSNVSILIFFKYFNFLNNNASTVLNFFKISNPIPTINIILPIGLSFHTFQAMSYTIEVYLGRQKAERHIGIYALYVMFYPQLVAGPIERPQNLLHQFYEKHNFNYRQVTDGLKLMAWGFFKKLVIADRLAVMVNCVYSAPRNYDGISLITATIFFAFQIYCDFSGYSDIAIGCAQAMGFKLMQNFDRPYLSSSISKFWRCWHISLTTWFTDYIYIPLGGNRVTYFRHCINLFTVFLISGLWHGASWTFVLWGALNGLYLIFGSATKRLRLKIASYIGLTKIPKIYNVFQITTTFILICFSWIFFRAESLTDTAYIIRNLLKGVGSWVYYFITHLTAASSGKLAGLMIGMTTNDFILALAFIAILITVESIQTTKNIVEQINRQHKIIRWIIYYSLITSTILLGVYSNTKFIYFQF